MNKKISMLFVLMTATALIACGGGGGGGGTVGTGNISSVSVVSSTSTGDFTPSITPSVGEGKNIQFTVGGVDLDSDGTVEKPSITSVKATVAAASAMKAVTDATITCESRDVGGGSAEDKYDIGICLDTTSSMGAAAGILAGKVADFANALAAAGVDAEFAGITDGDAFATKKETGSIYETAATTLGLTDNTVGTLTPEGGTMPTFDPDERPNSGTTLLSAENIANFFSIVRQAVSSGAGGNDGAENYLGCVQYLNNETSWRSGATKIIISIGDNCAHTDESYASAYYGGIKDPWIPPAGATLAADLAGNAVVHVIGSSLTTEYEGEVYDSCASSSEHYYDPKGLATATGGTFTEIGSCGSVDTCNVDLTSLPITSAITSGVVYTCDGAAATYEATAGSTITVSFTITVTATGSTSGTTSTATTVLVLSIVFE